MPRTITLAACGSLTLLLTACLTSQEDYKAMLAYATDADGDGFAPRDGDCDDDDPKVRPDAEETWYDGVDEDCAGDDDYDVDVDGFVLDEDCDDNNDDVSPAATEVCNGIDDDCDGLTDEGLAQAWYLDGDGDGQGDPDRSVFGCLPPDQYVGDDGDCDDGDPGVYSGAEEVCGDGVINDCEATESACVLSGERSLNEVGGEIEGQMIVGDMAFNAYFGTSAQMCGGRLVVAAPWTGGDFEGSAYFLDPASNGTIEGDLTPLATLQGGNDQHGVGQTMVCLVDLPSAPGTVLAVGAGADLVFVEPTQEGTQALADVAIGTWDSMWSSKVLATGDVLGDGVADLIVGKPFTSPRSGVIAIANTFSPLGDANELMDVVIVHDDSAAKAGSSLAVSDLNGDGIDDIAAGAPGFDGQAGAVAVLYGPVGSGVLDDADVWHLGLSAGDTAGAAVASGEDVDGDGVSDLAIAAPAAQQLNAAVGSVWLLSGADVNTATLNDALARFDGAEDGDAFGTSILMMDDDADGAVGLFIGAPEASLSAAVGGGVYLFRSPSAGLYDTADADLVLSGTSPAGNSGQELFMLPDLSGDGLPELGVASPRHGDSGERPGSLSILYGWGD